jgi:enamine deaminase RidA (YjgF/YER057c/UK114 family)
MSVYNKLELLGITLPPATPAAGAYVPVARAGNILYVAGHIAKREGKPLVGRLGTEFTTDEGKQAARSVALDLIGTLHGAIGDLNKITRIAKIMVLVNSAGTFTEQHLVANGASEVIGEIFGDAGKHARSAFGVAQLPFGSCVEIELIAEALSS